MAHHLIGIDVGGTKTEVCLLEIKNPESVRSIEATEYKILNRERTPTHKNGTFENFLSELRGQVLRVVSAHGLTLQNIQGMGVGLPGSIDPIAQVMTQGSVPFFKNKELIQSFKTALNYSGPLWFDNDANCFALAETYLGAGRKWATENRVPLSQLNLIGIILGTGVGGGLIVNGKLIQGRRGGAGELGHMALVESGRPCYCGKHGCAEQYLSGPAFEYFYACRASVLEPLNAKQIFQRADEHDPLAIANIDFYRDYLVTHLSNLANCLDPHVIVLGGGMSTQSRIYTGISERLSRGCFLTENPPAVLQHECGDSAGVLGAALLGLFKQLEITA